MASASAPRASLPTPPCSHNVWDDVRTRKGAKVLRCRVCQVQWKVRAGVPRCIPFLHGECDLADCAYVHVFKQKERAEERALRFGPPAEAGGGDGADGCRAAEPVPEPVLGAAAPPADAPTRPAWRWDPYAADGVCVAAGTAPAAAPRTPSVPAAPLTPRTLPSHAGSDEEECGLSLTADDVSPSPSLSRARSSCLLGVAADASGDDGDGPATPASSGASLSFSRGFSAPLC